MLHLTQTFVEVSRLLQTQLHEAVFKGIVLICTIASLCKLMCTHYALCCVCGGWLDAAADTAQQKNAAASWPKARLRQPGKLPCGLCLLCCCCVALILCR